MPIFVRVFRMGDERRGLRLEAFTRLIFVGNFSTINVLSGAEHTLVVGGEAIFVGALQQNDDNFIKANGRES